MVYGYYDKPAACEKLGRLMSIYGLGIMKLMVQDDI